MSLAKGNLSVSAYIIDVFVCFQNALLLLYLHFNRRSVCSLSFIAGGQCPYQANIYCWFCIMCKPRLKCSLGSLARLSTLS